ncbi:MAG: excinuclease ABC subunit UvrC [Thermoguttaceae bacterium]|nr:excinuclease ABC subunit UvrC [Thermoguttaceae bacterium]
MMDDQKRSEPETLSKANESKAANIAEPESVEPESESESVSEAEPVVESKVEAESKAESESTGPRVIAPGDELYVLLGSAVYAAEKVRKFPMSSGVYLMKDAAGRVIYVGKAKHLRNRAGSYFTKAALEDPRTCRLVPEIRDIDYLETDSEVDALLLESRLIKDIQPQFNRGQKDDKTFPYLEIMMGEDFPRVRITHQLDDRHSKIFGPFTSSGSLRGAIQVLQKIFRFRTCTLDITEAAAQWQWFRPCILHSIRQCSAPCGRRITREDYRKDIRRLIRFLDGGKRELLKELQREMQAAATGLNFEEAARLRDEIRLLETLDQRGELETNVQPEVFAINPKEGVESLQKLLKMSNPPRVIEGVDIAHLAGDQTVASLVQFLDGIPFKPHYLHYRIREVEGINDPACIYEVVSRRFARLIDGDDPFPDLMLIDGGKAQLGAAISAVQNLRITPLPRMISLAKREEEIYTPEVETPIRLPRNRFALRLLQSVRDEAHRFAQHYHHILRKKSQFDE